MRSNVRVMPFFFCAGLALIFVSHVAAQPAVSIVALKKAYGDVDARHRELKNGTDSAKKKTDEKVAEAVAEWHIYRVAIKTEKNDLIQQDFNLEVDYLVKDKKNAANKRAYINLLGPACVTAVKHVFTSTDIKLEPSMVIHAAQLLPIMARLRQDDVSNYLIELIDDPKTNDVIRLHALKAMKEVFPIRTQLDLVIPDQKGQVEDFKDKDQNARRKQDAANVEVLVKYIERPPVKVQNMDPEDLATFRFFRREAITSLAAAGAPAVTAHIKAPRKPLDGLVAPTLLKVLTKNGLQPPTTLHEKIEAAIGLCYLEYPWMPEYHPDVAVHLVSKTFVDFVSEYTKDHGVFAVEGKSKQLPHYAFKADGKRFDLAFKKLEENAKPDSKFSTASNPNTVKNVAELKM